jgi:uncharacterized membrane protein YeaQ/YmgE (transglycosylase-associated protein family)
MGLLSWIVVVGIAGWLSGQVMKGQGFGLLGDIFVGIASGLIAGGLVGGWLAGSLFKVPDAVNSVNVTSILVAFVLIVIVRIFQGRSRMSLPSIYRPVMSGKSYRWN